jgi:hypothetical protein
MNFAFLHSPQHDVFLFRPIVLFTLAALRRLSLNSSVRRTALVPERPHAALACIQPK